MLTQPRTNAFTAAYDWRLSCASLENRDHYFTRLRSHIETAVLTSDEKVVLVSHVRIFEVHVSSLDQILSIEACLRSFYSADIFQSSVRSLK